jgi:hypothetical protein
LSFPELAFFESLLETLDDQARVKQWATIQYGNEKFPLYSASFGSQAAEAPSLLLVGGVHGQEKIGAQVVLSYLETLADLVQWDELTHHALKKCRISFLPIVNPVGMFLLRRGNGNRVDLMRNSPLESKESVTPLLGGQRISPYIPWYRGKMGDPMETEAQALCQFVREECFSSVASIALDCHSGYGTVDRLWFPYSHSTAPYPDLADAYALKTMLDQAQPNHVYRMEPSAQGYTINGDIWDHLYLQHKTESGGHRTFFPVTLEMGSWIWLKKNPAQLFSSIGMFHPLHLHRHKRILRRHFALFDFLQRAVVSHQTWAGLSATPKEKLSAEALEHWYGKD